MVLRCSVVPLERGSCRRADAEWDPVSDRGAPRAALPRPDGRCGVAPPNRATTRAPFCA